jgi:uncharacterized protein (TIGR02145 family)
LFDSKWRTFTIKNISAIKDNQMIKSSSLFTVLSLLVGVYLTHQEVSAQVPQGLTYQSVVRNINNDPLASTSLGIQLSIFQKTLTGTAVYVETQIARTNINGLVSLQIGKGNPLRGTFAEIDWANGPYFIKTEIDPTGGSNYNITGAQELLSVPYAFYAAKSGGNVFETSLNVSDAIYNTNAGNVGIGTDQPSEKLDVAGNLRVRQNASISGTLNIQPLIIDGFGPNFQYTPGSILLNGSMGIGTDLPTALLNIVGSDRQTGLRVEGGNASLALVSKTEYQIYSRSEGDLVFYDQTAELDGDPNPFRMLINASGNIGVSNPNPIERLDVAGNIKSSASMIANNFVKSGGTASQFLMADGSVSQGLMEIITSMQTEITALQSKVRELLPLTFSNVKIGTQTWTSTNLNVTTYRNGDAIPEVQNAEEWANLTTGAWCHLNNDPANDAIYGKIYNHYAIEDSRGLAPVGYHIPSFAEYEILIQTLPVGECGSDKWYNAFALMSLGFYNGTNSSGFSALKGGSRSGDAMVGFFDFDNKPAGVFDTHYTSFWTSDAEGSYNYIYLAEQCGIGSTDRASNYGAYIRLIKN